MKNNPKNTEIAVLGGGCFWCIEATMQLLNGVIKTQPAYTRGSTEHPTYQEVCQGNTGHIEVVVVEFIPSIIDYDTLLHVYFASHDPTSFDKQGHDIGPQYRSMIMYMNANQQARAEALIQQFNINNTFGAPIVTQLLPPHPIWIAEHEHHDYFYNHPQQSYCNYIINPKVLKIRDAFSHLLKDTP